MNWKIMIVTSILIAGCASAPLDPRTITVHQSEIRDYWRMAEIQPHMNLPPTSRAATTVVFRYAIESDGTVSHVEVLDYEGAILNVRYLAAMLEGTVHEPAPGNPDRTPILVEQEQSYSEVHSDNIEDLFEHIEKESAGKTIESIDILPIEHANQD